MKKIQDRHLTYLFPLIAFAFLFIYSPSVSPLYLYEGFDSCTFKTIGLGILDGKIPYTNLFDHKGPILFWLNALGLGILPGRWGLFLLETLFLTLTLVFSYKSAGLFAEKRKAFFASLLTLIPAIDFITEGNQCEEYMLPFIAVSLYLALRYTTGKTEEHPLKYSLFYGFSFGWTFFIRPNDAVSHIGAIMLGIFLILLTKKEFRSAILNALIFIGGILVVFIPVIGYFLMTGSLEDMLHGTILYNLKYSAESGLTEGSIGILAIPTIIYGGAIWMSRKNGDKSSSFIFIPTLFLTLILIGKRDYYHYLLPIIPMTTIFFGLCLKGGYKKVAAVICVLFAIFSFRQHKMLFRSLSANEEMSYLYEQTRSLIDMVPEDERHHIWNHNLYKMPGDRSPHIYSMTGIWTNAGISPDNRVFIFFHRGNFDESISLETNRPGWVLAGPHGNDSYDDIFLNANYTAIGSTSEDCIAEVTLYKLNGNN